MNTRVEFRRLVVLRMKDGDRPFTMRQPLTSEVRVAVLADGGFGCDVYLWDGKRTTVSGLPVYQ